MSRISKSLAIIISISVVLVSGFACTKKAEAPAAATQTAIVHMGDLTASTAVDGNLVMPQAYNLLFGAPGNVQNVFVQEGDVVKEGTVLATLDNTSQKLAVESANNNVQTVLAKLYENVPLLPQMQTLTYEKIDLGPPTTTIETLSSEVKTYFNGDTDIPPLGSTTTSSTSTMSNDTGMQGVSSVTETTIVNNSNVTHVVGPTTTTVTTSRTRTTTVYRYFISRSGGNNGGNRDTSSAYYYPNSTALSAYNWAQDEINLGQQLYQIDNYAAASSQLYLALSDLDACIAILQDAINNPKSGLGNMAPFVPEDEAGIMQLNIANDQSWEISYIVQLRNGIDVIKQGQSDISTVRGLIDQGKYDEAGQLFTPLLKKANDIAKIIYKNINVIKAHSYSTVYGVDISNHFYNAAADKLTSALKGIESGGLSASQLNDNLIIAEHYMRLCNSILGSNDYVLQHGLSLKNEQQAHVDLQNALTGLGNAQQDFLKTVILAPFDGTVVNVGVKKNDVLSQIDYASVTAVQLVDTRQIKFQGQVDEIDILQIQTGQKATIEVDAVPNKVFTGVVSFISPFGTPDTNGVIQFPVTIQLDPTEVELKGGLTSTANIVISGVENALLVPLTAVVTLGTRSFVTVVDKATGKEERRPVTLGEKNLQFAQVLSGLKEGDEVAILNNVGSAPVVKGFPQRSVAPGR
ncbi:MAG TPA: efflux RND transporter periplasmic adaptor subunit [Dehalococcoidia bacterium]